jgi:hypothetical protein
MMNRPETISQSLRCPLTDQEKIRFGEGLARLLEEMGEVEDEQKASAAKFKGQLEGIDGAVTKARKILSAGYEYRWIDCKVLYNKPASRQKTIVRLDTGEEVRIEDMSEAECQENLPLRPSGVAEVIAEKLPEMLNLQPDAPAPVVETPIQESAKAAVEHGSNGKRKRSSEKTDPQTQGAGVYPA